MQKFKLVTCLLFAKYYIEVGDVVFGPPGIGTMCEIDVHLEQY